jgi:hypothetical protein
MSIIKFILGVIGLIFVGMLLLWAIGAIWSIIWWLFWIGVVAAIGYGGYKLFLKAEAKALGADRHAGLDPADIQMSWDEYDKKYLRK